MDAGPAGWRNDSPSEGLRPKLPWAPKLDLFINKPAPVFQILDTLKKEHIKFVKKSVANNLTDYPKVNPGPTRKLIEKWKAVENEHTQWIINYATRKLKSRKSMRAVAFGIRTQFEGDALFSPDGG